MSAKDKKETLADLNEALKAPGPAIENKGNIDLVGKYYDKLSEAFGDDERSKSNSLKTKKPRRISPGLCRFRGPRKASGAGAHPHHEAVVAEFGDLIPGQRFVPERARLSYIFLKCGLVLERSS